MRVSFASQVFWCRRRVGGRLSFGGLDFGQVFGCPEVNSGFRRAIYGLLHISALWGHFSVVLQLERGLIWGTLNVGLAAICGL